MSKSKTVGLVIVTYKDNFGSALQSYATQKAVQKLGYDTEILRIEGVEKQIQRKKILFFLSRLVKKDELKYVADKALSKFKSESTGDYSKNMAVRHKMYESFNAEFFRFAEKKNSFSELSALCKKYDAVLVGSDQLWRPSNIAGGYFTLEFVPDEVKKIAFSTSFGVSVIPALQRGHAKRYLSRIEHISVRENSGKKLVKELINRDIPVVTDPTMLFDINDWQEIVPEKHITTGDYILTYFMGDNPKHREFVKRLKAKTGYKIVSLLHGSVYVASDEDFPDEKPYDVGPGEFIDLIANARYMVTDSFHGSVFSILNRTPFFTMLRYEDKSAFSSNDRVHTLLSWTGLPDRLLTGDEDVNEQLNKTIDFESVLRRVEENRKQSWGFLENALNK